MACRKLIKTRCHARGHVTTPLRPELTDERKIYDEGMRAYMHRTHPQENLGRVKTL
jgi:hypothetical protein